MQRTLTTKTPNRKPQTQPPTNTNAIRRIRIEGGYLNAVLTYIDDWVDYVALMLPGTKIPIPAPGLIEALDNEHNNDIMRTRKRGRKHNPRRKT